MEYKTRRLREKDRAYVGGMEGVYRSCSKAGFTRKQIAQMLCMSVYTLEKWITRWNKTTKEEEGRGREEARPEGASADISPGGDHRD